MADEDGRTGRATVWGVVAGIFATGAFTTWPVAVAANSTFPLWPTYVFVVVAAISMYLCFSTIWGWWPTRRSLGQPAAASIEPAAARSDTDVEEAAVHASRAVSGSVAAVPVNLSSPAVPIRLMPELDVATNLAAQGRLLEQQTVVEPELAPAAEPTSAFTDRWLHTSNGDKVPALMRLTNTSVFHPGYMSRQSDKTPPSVKVGMVVGCQPIDPNRSGTGLRAKFLSFLNSPAVSAVVTALTDVEPSMTWTSLAGNGPRTLEAALTAGADPMEGVPVASALLLLPTPGEALYGRDERSATLMLCIEPRTADGQVPPASDLTTWYQRFSLALAVPHAFATFLSGGIGLATFSDPPAQLGVWLQSYQPLTVMVDIDGLRVLPGRSTSNQFIGWTLAALDGKSAAGAARDLLIDLCEYKLNLDDFEQALPGESP